MIQEAISSRVRKKLVLISIAILFFNLAFSQKTFPYNVHLKDTLGYNVPSKLITNLGKPLLLEFFGTHCKPCIDLLDSFKEVYPEWQKKYGLKIIVIVGDKKSKRKKMLRMIKEHDWPFQFYFDYERKLTESITSSNIVPQTVIYDGQFQMVGKFLGVKPNYGYKVVDGNITGKKVKINTSGKYKDLECNLTDYENTLEFLVKE